MGLNTTFTSASAASATFHAVDPTSQVRVS
jgi:hypothetical protein